MIQNKNFQKNGNSEIRVLLTDPFQVALNLIMKASLKAKFLL